MEILNTTALRKWAKERGLSDNWWYTVDGGDVSGPSALGEIQQSGKILVLNDEARSTPEERWFIFRYRGFKTEEEKQQQAQKKLMASAKQIVALEFFGHAADPETITKEKARELLDVFFARGSNYGDYQEHIYANLPRLYSGKLLMGKCINMLQTKLFYIKENVSSKRLDGLVEELIEHDIHYKKCVEYIQNAHPTMLLAESTRERKVSEYNKRNSEIAEWKAAGYPSRHNNEKRGCLGIVVFCCAMAALVGFAVLGVIRWA